MHTHDVIGIGFGPSNVALAIALQEMHQAGCQPVDMHFIEQRPSFAWHPDMMLANTHMQVSFLKDLVSLRNPCSPHSFVNYLHQKGRLPHFINLKTFLPSRHEFNDYIRWAAAHFQNVCTYGERVQTIQPQEESGRITRLRLQTVDTQGNTREYLTRNLALGLGGTPRLPDIFRPLQDDPRVFHSHHYLQGIAHNPQARSIALIGAGQSAAEVFMNLHDHPHRPEIDLIMRARVIKPADDSPFVNEIFNADLIDEFFGGTPTERQDFLTEFHHTNYACPDTQLIERIYRIFYEQKVTGQERHQLLPRHIVTHVQADDDGIYLGLQDTHSLQGLTRRYDAVILATGYEREQHRPLLAALAPYSPGLEVDRHYRLKTTPDFLPHVYIQGHNEKTHGLADTLLSVMAIRTGEIAQALTQALQQTGQTHDDTLPTDAHI